VKSLIARPLALILSLASAGPALAATVSDPTGDTFSAGPDVTAMSATYDATNLNFSLTFAATATDVVAGIDLDLDQNTATSSETPATGTYCGGGGLTTPAGFGKQVGKSGSVTAQLVSGGVDAVLWLDTGSMTVDTGSATWPITVAGNVISFSVPFSDFSASSGPFDADAVVGNTMSPSDCIPDSGVLTADTTAPAIPTLAPLALLALFGGAASAGAARLRRRS